MNIPHLKSEFVKLKGTASNLRGCILHISGGSKGGHWGSKFFQFHAVFGKIWQKLYVGPPPMGSWRPILGEILDPPLHVVPNETEVNYIPEVTVCA